MTGRTRTDTKYQAWAPDGWLETTPGNVTDYRAVQAAIAEDARTFGLVDMGMDVLFQGTQIATELQEDEGITVFGMGTGMRTMSGPCKELERRLYGEGFNSDLDGVLKDREDDLDDLP